MNEQTFTIISSRADLPAFEFTFPCSFGWYDGGAGGGRSAGFGGVRTTKANFPASRVNVLSGHVLYLFEEFSKFSGLSRLPWDACAQWLSADL